MYIGFPLVYKYSGYLLLVNKQWGYFNSENTLVTIKSNISISKILYANVCDGVSAEVEIGTGYFLGIANTDVNNITFKFKEAPYIFRWFIIGY